MQAPANEIEMQLLAIERIVSLSKIMESFLQCNIHTAFQRHHFFQVSSQAEKCIYAAETTTHYAI